MTEVTKIEFHKMKEKLGGDFWNQYLLCKTAFKKFPDATKIQYSLGTGLWCDITYYTANGEKKKGSIYDGDLHRL